MNCIHLRRAMLAGAVMFTCGVHAAEPDSATLQAEIDQVTAEINELTARTPNSKEAYALRKAARDAWRSYTSAKSENAKVKQVQSKIEKAVEQLRALQKDQNVVADADTDLAALKQLCADAIAVVRAAETTSDRKEAVLAARKARDTYVAARKKNADVAQIQAQIDQLKADISQLNTEKQSVADGETDLVTLKTAWLSAVTAAKEYLPTRAKLVELAKQRQLLLEQQAELGGAE